VHAVVVKVKISGDTDTAQQMLREEVVPQISKAPGFVAGYWTRKENTGISMVVFDSEEEANQASERVRSMAPENVTVEDVEVREVVANA
jgi:hypothetical protein